MSVTEVEKSRPRASRVKAILLAVCAWAFVVGVVALTISMQRPPSPVGASAQPSEFSSARAMLHLKSIAREPHPIGSPAHAAVREYIVGELESLGLAPEVQEATAVSKAQRRTVAADVRNVVARMPGSGGGGEAVMLVAHYDSVMHSHGASDDGAGVAALLETARALKSGPAPRNDVIFLFTDGEELGLLGARAFVNEHRWAKDVKAALNFEARGSGGPVFMFETSERNGRLVGAVADAAPAPFASSLMYQLYKFLPNDTDMSVFKKAGIAGLNFAYVDGLSHYHTPLDNLDTVDEGSVQHHGSYALALARRLGTQNLNELGAPDAVYFDIFGRTLISYPQAWALPLAILCALGFAALTVFGLRRRKLKVSGLLLGFAALLSSVVVSAALVEAARFALRFFNREAPANENFVLVGFAALAVSATAAVYIFFVKRVSANGLMAGALLMWVLLTLAASALLPGVSHIFAWPLLFGLLGFAYALTRGGEAESALLSALVACLYAIPAVVLLSANIYLLFLGLRLQLPALLVVLQVLLLGLLVPHIRLAVASARWLFPATAVAAGVVCLVIGGMAPARDRNHPQTDVVIYSSDADSGDAVWASVTKPTEWSKQFFAQGSEVIALPGRFPNVDGKYLVSKAPAVELKSDELEVLGDETKDGVRTLKMRVASPRGARVVSLYVDPGAEVLAATVGGQRVEYKQTGDGKLWWELTYAAFPREGAEVTLETKASGPLQVKVVSQSDGLPGAAQAAFQSRPPYSIPARNSDTTNVTRTFTLNAGSPASARLTSGQGGAGASN
ncbi:MAG: M20/M25/M40 family metallo-hydrolase [Pyrinomonadaceae bacterium]